MIASIIDASMRCPSPVRGGGFWVDADCFVPRIDVGGRVFSEAMLVVVVPDGGCVGAFLYGFVDAFGGIDVEFFGVE